MRVSKLLRPSHASKELGHRRVDIGMVTSRQGPKKTAKIKTRRDRFGGRPVATRINPPVVASNAYRIHGLHLKLTEAEKELWEAVKSKSSWGRTLVVVPGNPLWRSVLASLKTTWASNKSD